MSMKHTKYAWIFIAVLLALLLALPAKAQEVPPTLPVVEEPGPLPKLHLPLAPNQMRFWFDDADLAKARQEAEAIATEWGYNPLGYAVPRCTESAHSTPDHVKYDYCSQNLTDALTASYWHDADGMHYIFASSQRP